MGQDELELLALGLLLACALLIKGIAGVAAWQALGSGRGRARCHCCLRCWKQVH